MATRSKTIPTCDPLDRLYRTRDGLLPSLLCLRFNEQVPPEARIAMDQAGWRYDAARNEWRVAYHAAQLEQRAQEIRNLIEQWQCTFYPHFPQRQATLEDLCENYG